MYSSVVCTLCISSLSLFLFLSSGEESDKDLNSIVLIVFAVEIGRK